MERKHVPLTLLTTLFSVLLSVASYGQHVHRGSQPEVPPKTSAMDIEKFSNGYPNITDGFLPKERMVPVETQRLAQAKVVWVNLDLLRDMGFEVPVEGITPAFEEVLLEAFAYVAPNDRIEGEKFLAKKKTFYADRYGGEGVGFAEGSGRAAGAGLFQIKGIGRTPLAEELPKNKEPLMTWDPTTWGPTEIFKRVKSRLSELHHSHGGATFREAMAEAIWGEVLHRELPYDANRVAVVIATDLKIGVLNETRALIVRQNSKRPAHFMSNLHRMSTNRSQEKKELKNMKPELVKFLSQLQGETKDISPEDFVAGQKEFIKRVARTFAVEYARGIFHGSLSPSNIELTGRAVDHGPLTYIDGYTKAIFADEFPNGDTRDFMDCILTEFFENLQTDNIAMYKNRVLKGEEIKEVLNTEFDRQVRLEFLWLSGCPEDLREDLLKDPKIVEFADLLRSMGEAGNTKIVNVRARVPKNHGDYDISEILLALSSSHTSTSELEKSVQNPKLRESLLALHQHFDTRLHEIMKAEGYRQTGVDQYVQEAVQKRNKKLFGLMRGVVLWAKFYGRIMMYRLTKSVKVISSFIEDTILENTRNLPEMAANVVVLEEIGDYKSGSIIRKIYDGKTGEYKYQGSFQGNASKVNVFGQILDKTALGKKPIVVRTKDGMTLEMAQISEDDVGMLSIVMKAIENPNGNAQIISIDRKFKSKEIRSENMLTHSNIGTEQEMNLGVVGELLCNSVFVPL